MENFSNTCKLEEFKTISVVTKGVYTTSLVQDPFSGIRYVKKELSIEKLPLYQKLQSLKHQGLAEIIDIIKKDCKLIVLIEYVAGNSLKTVLEHQIKLEERVATSYIHQLASILNVVHQNGIIHRDITPSNIIITSNGQVKLIDFDIARFYKSNQTEDTQLLGTPGYAAPEQFGFNQTTASTDIYALGVLLNVMITGMKPNEIKIKSQGLALIVENCTAMDQSLRYQDVVQLDYELRRLKLHPEKPLQKEAYQSIRHPKMMIALAGGFILLLGRILFFNQHPSAEVRPVDQLWGQVLYVLDEGDATLVDGTMDASHLYAPVRAQLEHYFGQDFASMEVSTITRSATIRINFNNTLTVDRFQEAVIFTRNTLVREMAEIRIGDGLSTGDEYTVFEVYISLLDESGDRTWQFVLGNHIAPGREPGFVSGQLDHLPNHNLMRIPLEDIQKNIDFISSQRHPFSN